MGKEKFHYMWPSFPDNDPLILTEEEKRDISAFDSIVIGILYKKRVYLRGIARRNGLISPTLEGLKSKSGKPFVIEEDKNRDGFKRAVITESSPTGFLVVVEAAYLCKGRCLEEDPDSCGWVKGTPIEKKYDYIGPLSGSAGIKYYCKICEKEIGRLRMMMS